MVRDAGGFGRGALLLLGLAAQMCLTALAATPLFVDVALRGRQVSSGRPSRLATLAKKRRKRKDRVVEDAPALSGEVQKTSRPTYRKVTCTPTSCRIGMTH